jgi:hypothetical protein
MVVLLFDIDHLEDLAYAFKDPTSRDDSFSLEPQCPIINSMSDVVSEIRGTSIGERVDEEHVDFLQ